MLVPIQKKNTHSNIPINPYLEHSEHLSPNDNILRATAITSESSIVVMENPYLVPSGFSFLHNDGRKLSFVLYSTVDNNLCPQSAQARYLNI